MKKDYGLSKHHRKLKSHGGHGKPSNISVVTDAKHKAWHVLFADKRPHEIAETINAIWLDPDFMFVCKRRTP